ncbi:transposase, IS4 [Nostoc commune NIES-4072]|uniref:Transposase, IS4 n=1 Tax=Nostoc commune NIES-4072 TaxID=2005467 RepID=A0A2R5FS85_NOSCO|nr:transposase, IS4 [Nostoc commune NIES-4072]
MALTDLETLEEVLECLTENFSIETTGVCDQKTLFEILIKAASSGDSIENTAKIIFIKIIEKDLGLKVVIGSKTSAGLEQLIKSQP